MIVRNHSADVDINVILIANTTDTTEMVILDFNKGKCRKLLRLSEIDLTDDEEKCLIRFHAFTGSDYTSAFFAKSRSFVGKFYVTIQSFYKLLLRLVMSGCLRKAL